MNEDTTPCCLLMSRMCQCLASPRQTEARDGVEVFDFTSKKSPGKENMGKIDLPVLIRTRKIIA